MATPGPDSEIRSEGEELGNDARQAFGASREGRDRTLEALRRLEAALAMASMISWTSMQPTSGIERGL